MTTFKEWAAANPDVPPAAAHLAFMAESMAELIAERAGSRETRIRYVLNGTIRKPDGKTRPVSYEFETRAKLRLFMDNERDDTTVRWTSVARQETTIIETFV